MSLLSTKSRGSLRSHDFQIVFAIGQKKNKEISIYFSIRYLRIGRLLGVKAGIAQLVEQATENRRVPSSNLGPGTIQIRTFEY